MEVKSDTSAERSNLRPKCSYYIACGQGGRNCAGVDLKQVFKPLHTLFCRAIKICCDVRSFLESLGKKRVFFGLNPLKSSFMGLGVHY